MKKIIVTSIFSFLIFHISFAQDPTPNSGFENWTLVNGVTQYYIPDGWDQLNAATNFLGVLTCVQDPGSHSGSFGVKLITKIVTTPFGTDTANGIITTGHLILVPPYGVTGGIPFHSRPDSIYGWFKYAPSPGDSTQIEFDLIGANHDTIGTALFKSGETLSVYTRFAAPIVYFSSATPDTSLWLISSSNGFHALPNSTLSIDDIGLIYHTGVQAVTLDDFISISPDPANDFIIVKNKTQTTCELTLYNEEGKAVKKFLVLNELSSFNISDLAEGIYFARLTDAKINFLAAGKILIQH